MIREDICKAGGNEVREKHAAVATANFSCRSDGDQQSDRSPKGVRQSVLSSWPFAGIPARGARRAEFPHVYQPDDCRRDGKTQRDSEDVWRADDHGEEVYEVVPGRRDQGILRNKAAA